MFYPHKISSLSDRRVPGRHGDAARRLRRDKNSRTSRLRRDVWNQHPDAESCVWRLKYKYCCEENEPAGEAGRARLESSFSLPETQKMKAAAGNYGRNFLLLLPPVVTYSKRRLKKNSREVLKDLFQLKSLKLVMF